MKRNIADWINKIRSGQNPGYALLIVGPQGAGKSMLSTVLAAQTGLPLAEIASGVDYVKWIQEPAEWSTLKHHIAAPADGVKGVIIETTSAPALCPSNRRFLVIRLEGVRP